MQATANDRKTAIQLGLSRYSTGEICRNGHLSDRYTQSGTCVACLRESQSKASAAYSAARTAAKLPDGDRFARAIISHRERVPLRDLESLQTVGEALLAGRFPELVGRVAMRQEPRPTHSAGNTAIVAFLCHRDDVPVLHALCDHALQQFSAENFAAVRP